MNKIYIFVKNYQMKKFVLSFSLMLGFVIINAQKPSEFVNTFGFLMENNPHYHYSMNNEDNEFPFISRKCIYYQPSVSNGILKEWDSSSGRFVVTPTCPKCGRESSTSLIGGEGYTSGKELEHRSCINRSCVPKGEITFNYNCLISWPSPKCD